MALLLLTGVAFFVRLLHLTRQSLWRDEVDAIRFSDWPVSQLVAGLFHAGHNGPLFFLALRPWRVLTGDSEFALRYPSALLGTLAVPLGFILARQIGFSRRAGLLLGLLLATSPYLVWYGQEAKMYTILLALITLGFIAYLKALQAAPAPPPLSQAASPAVWWLIFVVATSLSFYTHILSPLMLIVYGVVALLHPAHLRQHWRGWLLSMACLTLPYLPLAAWQLPLLLGGFQSGHPDYSAQDILSLLFQIYSSGLVRFTDLTGTILYLFLLLCGLYLGGRTAKKRSPSSLRKRSLLAAWIFLPPVAVYLISLRVAVFEDRYLIYITPAFYLLAVIGLIHIRRYSTWLAGLCLGLMLTFNVIGLWQQSRPIKADFRSAAAHLSAQPEPPTTIMVQIPYLQHTLAYYYQADYTLLEGLWTNDGKSEAQASAEMAERIGEVRDLWLVVSEEALWDSRGLTRQWLDRHGDLIEQATFRQVDLYRYQIRAGATDRVQATATGQTQPLLEQQTTSPLLLPPNETE